VTLRAVGCYLKSTGAVAQQADAHPQSCIYPRLEDTKQQGEVSGERLFARLWMPTLLGPSLEANQADEQPRCCILSSSGRHPSSAALVNTTHSLCSFQEYQCPRCMVEEYRGPTLLLRGG
jgi:hypothetical protein